MKVFFDTNVLVYAVGVDDKGRIARDLLDAGGLVSVQCLNEFANVALRKLKMEWDEVAPLLDAIRTRCAPVIALTEARHVAGTRVARKYRLSVYDGMILAAALSADCDILYSEDMHHGLVIDGRLTITNPFGA